MHRYQRVPCQSEYLPKWEMHQQKPWLLLRMSFRIHSHASEFYATFPLKVRQRHPFLFYQMSKISMDVVTTSTILLPCFRIRQDVLMPDKEVVLRQCREIAAGTNCHSDCPEWIAAVETCQPQWEWLGVRPELTAPNVPSLGQLSIKICAKLLQASKQEAINAQKTTSIHV